MKIYFNDHKPDLPRDPVSMHVRGHDVTITEAFIGPLFLNASAKLGVCQRDDGFEVTYIDRYSGIEHSILCHNGTVKVVKSPRSAPFSEGIPNARFD